MNTLPDPRPSEESEEQAAFYVAGSLPTAERERFEQILEKNPSLTAYVGSLLDVASAALQPASAALEQPPESVRENLLQRLFPTGYPADFLISQGFANSDAVVLADAAGMVEWVNPAFSRMCGYSLDELKGKKAGTLLQGPMTDRAAVQRISQAVRARQKISETLLNYHKNGTSYQVHLVIWPIFDDQQELRGYAAWEQEIKPDFF